MFKDLHDYLYHLTPTGGLPMKIVGIVLGLCLLLSHLWAWKQSAAAKQFLQSFPRNYFWGVLLLSISFVWGMLALTYVDMGELFFLRKYFLIAVPIGFVLVLTQVKEFLAVRALGCFLLLLAGPVLASAFLQPQLTRLLLPTLAYIWIIAGMYMVGMPYLLRDAIRWLCENDTRWKFAVGSGVVYGAALLVFAIITY